MSTRSTKQRIVYEQKVTPRGEHYYKPYYLGKMLGKGGFATCYEIRYADDQNKYAVKIIQKESQHHTKHETVEKIKEEIALISSLDHPGIVKYIHDFQDAQNCYIILQLCPNGSLSDILKKRRYLTQPQIRFFIFQMMDIMKYIKGRNIIHRDIKLANYFLDQKFKLKLGDFGLATKNDQLFRSKRKMCGTPNYIAPEIIEKKVYGFEVDTWSTGVLIFTLAFGTPPFQTKTCKQTYERIKKCSYKFDGISKSINCSDDLKDFIKKILCLDPIKRLKIQDFGNHPFISRYHIPQELQVTFLASIPSSSFIKKYSKIIRKRQGCSLKKQASSTKQDITRIQNKGPKVTYKDVLYPQGFIQKNIVKETQYISPKVKKQEERDEGKNYEIFITPVKVQKNVQLKIEQNVKKQHESLQSKRQFQKQSKGRKKFCSNLSIQLQNHTEKKQNKVILHESIKQFEEQQFSIMSKSKQLTKNKQPQPKQQKTPILTKPITPVLSNWSRPTLTLKLKQLPNNQSKLSAQKQIKIIHFVNATQKYGIIYVLNSNQIGIYFNDASRMLLQSFDKTIHYIYKKGQQTIHKEIDMKQINKLKNDKIYSKIEILIYYQKILRNKFPIKTTQIQSNKTMAIPIHLKGFKMGKELTVFKLSSNNIQFYFQDGSNILLSFSDQIIVYQSLNGVTITRLMMSQKVDFQPEFINKIQTVFSFYGKWLPKNALSDIIDKYQQRILVK